MSKQPQVRVYDPRISVRLFKNISRESMAGGDGLGAQAPASGRFKGADRVIDLTPFLGENGGVRTSKSVRSPAGAFNITLADQMYMGKTRQMESLYGLIEPMDVVEIRIAHAPTDPAYVAEYQRLPEHLPIVMRGFVSSVRRSEVMSPDGRPARAIVVSGQDYGKLWQIMQIRYLANYVLGQDLLTSLRLAQNYGVNSGADFTANDFVREIIANVLNPFIDKMRMNSGAKDEDGNPVSPVRRIETLDLRVPDAKVSPFGINAWSGGTLFQLLSHYGDVGPWNELFLEDREDGVAVVYRPNPFYTPGGDEISPSSTGQKAAEVSITDADVVSVDVARTDANVANYFWVDNPSFALIQSETLRLQDGAMNPDTYYIENYRNCAPWLYGLRMMELQTNQGMRLDSQKKEDLTNGKGELLAWLNQRRRIIVQSNRDNVVFESGGLVLKGNERIRPGMYVKLKRGGLQQKMYAHQVDHNYMPMRTFTTSVSFDRGTGFVERAKRSGGGESPYLSELNAGGAYGGDA